MSRYRRLSGPQRAMLNRLRLDPGGERPGFTGNRHSGTTVSAWYRTAHSLAERGLIRMEREGDAWRAFYVKEEVGS